MFGEDFLKTLTLFLCLKLQKTLNIVLFTSSFELLITNSKLFLGTVMFKNKSFVFFNLHLG